MRKQPLFSKICGLKHRENISEISLLQPDFIGFIFYKKSKRYLNSNLVLSNINVSKVGVFVEEKLKIVMEKVVQYDLDAVQVHGRETPEYCRKLKTILPYRVKIIKAFQITDKKDFKNMCMYEPYCDYFLFDTASERYGGSGNSFDWSLLENYDSNIPFFISGGIGPENLEAALNINHPQLIGIDLNSKLELQPGIKSIEKSQICIHTIRNSKNTCNNKNE